MSLNALLGIARDSMVAHAGALDTVGQNVTNANVPGYSRRTAILETRSLGERNPGGVNFLGAQRAGDKYARARLVSESGLGGAAEGRFAGVVGLEASLSGLSGSVDAMFSAASTLASSPADTTARRAFLARASQVADDFRGASNALGERRTQILGDASALAGDLNVKLERVATLNTQIKQSEAGGVPANDMRDQRDQLVRELGDGIGVQAIEEPDGQYTLLAAGTSLVQGGDASSLVVDASAGGDMRVRVKTASGSMNDVTTRLESGKLAGLREARDVDVPAVQKELDQAAFDFVSSVNAVHTTGYGLDGNTGRPLFTPMASAAGAAAQMRLDPSVANNPSALAASSSAGGLPGDNTIALALGALSQTAMPGGGTPAARLGGLAAHLGQIQSGAQGAVELRENTLAIAEAVSSQASGVSIEEEMIQLTQFQRGFEASMRVLKVADELLESLVRGF
jgi:flagellar hook-associated protein 1